MMCHPLHITVGALIHRVFGKQMHDIHRDGYFALEAVLTEKADVSPIHIWLLAGTRNCVLFAKIGPALL